MRGYKRREYGRTRTFAGSPFFFPKRYEPIRCLGTGAYGVVCSAQDSTNKKKVAIKKVSQYTRSVNAAVHILREIRLMRLLGQHKCIITLKNLYTRINRDEIYLVMDYMQADLHQVIQSDQTLTGLHIQHFMFQLLKGIQYMHACGILHRDLKPGNLLVNSKCDLKIADFGLARERDPESTMTQHVVTRWYRAPELMLRPNGHYDASVDVWSVGCILGEMIGRKPMFPGKDFIHQLRLIFDVIGAPHKDEVAHIENEDALSFLESLKHKTPVRMTNLFPTASAEAVDLVESLLIFQPRKRLTIDGALAHNFLVGASNNFPLEIPAVPSNMECDFEGKKLTKREILTLIKREVQLLRGQIKKAKAKRLQRAQTYSMTTKKASHASTPSRVRERAKSVTSLSSRQHDSAKKNTYSATNKKASHTSTTSQALERAKTVASLSSRQHDSAKKKTYSATTKTKASHTSTASQLPERAETVASLSSRQHDIAKKLEQQQRHIIKEQEENQKQVSEQQKLSGKRNEHKQQTITREKASSSHSSGQPTQQEQQKHKQSEQQRKQVVDEKHVQQQKTLPSFSPVEPSEKKVASFSPVQSSEKVPFRPTRTQSEGNVMHELRRRSQLQASSALQPRDQVMPVASHSGDTDARNKSVSLVQRKRDIIRRTRSISEKLSQSDATGLEMNKKGGASLLVDTDPSPSKSTQNVRVLSPMARKLNEAMNKKGGSRLLVDTDPSPSKSTQNASVLSPMARKLNDMQNRFREGQISEESLVQRKRELIRRTRQMHAAATKDTSQSMPEKVIGSTVADMHDTQPTSSAACASNDVQKKLVKDREITEQEKMEWNAAVIRNSTPRSRRRMLANENEIPKQKPKQKKRGTTVTQPFKFHETRRRTRSAVRTKDTAKVGSGSMRRRLAEAMASNLMGKRRKSKKKLTVPQSPKFLNRSRRRRR